MGNLTKVTPLVKHFSDHERVLEILATSPWSDSWRYNRFLQHIEELPSLSVQKIAATYPNNERIGETILRILNMSKNLDSSGWKTERFLVSLERMILSDTIEEFEKLDPKTQSTLWKSYYSDTYIAHYQSCTDRAYLRLLTMTGMPVHNASFHSESVENYLDYARVFHDPEQYKRPNGQPLDLSDVTDEYIDQIYTILSEQKYTVNPQARRKAPDVRKSGLKITSKFRGAPSGALQALEPYRMQIILMLRALYGEDNISNMFMHFKESEQCLCANEMLDLVSEWDTLKNYPVEWTRQLKNLEH